MVDIPADILTSLACSKCDQLLKRGPVYQQHDGAAVCSLCQTREEAQPPSRCLLYEATAQLLRFPCRYQEEGCPAFVPFAAAGSTGFNHEDACEYRPYVCPVFGSNRCDWTGRRNQLLEHCREVHPDRVLPNPAIITPDIRRSQMTDYVIPVFHFLFLLHTRVCVSTAKLHYAVRLLGDPQEASSYTFTVTIQRGEDTISRIWNVLPQELLALQEQSALNFNTDGLLSVLGGWDDASLTVEVKARGPQPDFEEGEILPRRQAEQEEQCGQCRMQTPRLYRNRRGWLCANCAPRKYTCDNDGCDFQDIGDNKKRKHSTFFCPRRTQCTACKAVLQPNTPWTQHYRTCTKFKMISAGRFVIQRSNGWQCFLVETALGHMVCSCFYTEHKFYLHMLAPLPCEQLHLHRCEVRVECAGNTRTQTPKANYENLLDWEVVSDKDNFFTNPEVRVYIQLKKIE